MSVQTRGYSDVVVEITPERSMQVVTPTDKTKAGFVKLVDSEGNSITTTENGYVKVSSANVAWFDQVDGNAIDINKYDPRILNMIMAQTGGFRTLNASAITTANSYAINQSIKFIPLYGPLPFIFNTNAKVANVPALNSTIELGLGAVATTAAPTDGAFFRWAPDGTFKAVIVNNSVETTFIITAPATNLVHLYEIEIVEDLVIFAIDDIDVAIIEVPSGQGYPFNNGRQQVIERVYTGGSAPSLAPQLAIAQSTGVQEDMNQAQTFPETLNSLGRGWFQNPITGAQTSNHTNSMTVSPITLSNTTCANTSLGGKFAISSQAAGTTDGIVFGWQNDTGYQKTIYGIAISTVITGAAIVTATVLEWSLGINASALSLATVDTAFTSGAGQIWGPRRQPLGVQGFSALAGVGAVANDVVRMFPSGITIEPSRWLTVIVTIPNGAATGSLVYRGSATFLGGQSQ